jgi:hypothetical protein
VGRFLTEIFSKGAVILMQVYISVFPCSVPVRNYLLIKLKPVTNTEKCAPSSLTNNTVCISALARLV